MTEGPASPPLAGAPGRPVPLPSALTGIVGAAAVEAVWVNGVGGTTWRIAGGRRYVKWAPAGTDVDLTAEAARMRWAGGHTPVPAVIASGAGQHGSWLLTAGIDAESAVSPRWAADPAGAVAAVGTGLRAWHDAVPVDDCPWDWSAAVRVAHAVEAGDAGRLDPDEWHPEHAALGVEGALARLAEAPEPDLVVVGHGDACVPNTLVAADGSCAGHVDLGRLGVADRWADLAVATWSTNWNYGPGWERPLLDAYGIADDPDRRAWYRLLWDLAE